jgi:DNA-binding FadR family transcriptional regulator
LFKKTSHNRVFQDLVEQIQGAIVDGRLKPGDKLPPQRALMEMFATSRASIREALRVLEQKGLIEVKLGVQGGAVVKKTNIDPVTEVLTLLMHQNQVSPDHLETFRLCVEGEVAAMATRAAQAEDIGRLQRILARARECLERSPSDARDFIKVDIDLHIALAEITANPVFVAVVKMVHETILGYYDRFTPRRPVILEENYRDLCAIVAAVENGDDEKARRLSREHVRHFNRHMQAEVATAPAPPARS